MGINQSKPTIERISATRFKWPLHESTLVEVNSKVMSSNPTTTIGIEMVEKLKSFGIYREKTDCQLETNIRELARKTGLGLRRKSIRMSFDTFMSKSRPGLEDDGQAGNNCENIKIMDSKQVSDKIKERQFGNVRKRNNSWCESKRNSVQHEKRNSSNESTEKKNNSREMRKYSYDNSEKKYFSQYNRENRDNRENRKNSNGREDINKNYNQQNEKESSYLKAKDKRNNHSTD